MKIIIYVATVVTILTTGLDITFANEKSYETAFDKMRKLYEQSSPFDSQEELSGYWVGWSVNYFYPDNSDANLALAGKMLKVNGADKFFAVIMGLRDICGDDVDPATIPSDELFPILDKGLAASAFKDGCETAVGNGNSYTYCKDMSPPTKEVFHKVNYDDGKKCIIAQIENYASVSYAFLCKLQSAGQK
jgi:hypothetical protein